MNDEARGGREQQLHIFASEKDAPLRMKKPALRRAFLHFWLASAQAETLVFSSDRSE